jgi:hypothetical protein
MPKMQIPMLISFMIFYFCHVIDDAIKLVRLPLMHEVFGGGAGPFWFPPLRGRDSQLKRDLILYPTTKWSATF